MKENKRGKFLIECRKNKNLSQEQLGEILNYSRNNISKWERGISFPSDPNVLEKLSKIFDVSIEELLYGGKKAKNNTQEITNTLIEEYKLNYKKIFHQRITLIISIFLIIILALLSIYYIFIRGTIKVYGLSISDDNFYIEDSMLFVSNNFSSLNFNEIKSYHEENIEFVKLYYCDTNELIFGGENGVILIQEKNGYNEYKLNRMNKFPVCLSIKTSKNEYDSIKVNIEEMFVNDSIFPKKIKPISDDNSSNTNNNLEDVLIVHGFKTIDNLYYEKNINENVRILITYTSIRIDIFESDNKSYETIDGFTDSYNYIYTKTIKGNIIDSKSIDYNEIKNCDVDKCDTILDYTAYINYLKSLVE